MESLKYSEKIDSPPPSNKFLASSSPANQVELQAIPNAATYAYFASVLRLASRQACQNLPPDAPFTHVPMQFDIHNPKTRLHFVVVDDRTTSTTSTDRSRTQHAQDQYTATVIQPALSLQTDPAPSMLGIGTRLRLMYIATRITDPRPRPSPHLEAIWLIPKEPHILGFSY